MKNKYFLDKKLDNLILTDLKFWIGNTNYETASINGDWVARELYHLNFGLIGYERIFFNHNDTKRKYPKRPTYTTSSQEKSPAFTPIGCKFDDIHLQNDLIISSGIADGVTVFNATGIATLAIQGELNTSTLVNQLKHKFPKINLIIALDGDRTGRRETIKCSEKWVLPDNGDWNDLYIKEGLLSVKNKFSCLNNPIPDYIYFTNLKIKENNIKKFSLLNDYEEIAASAFMLCMMNSNLIPIKWGNENKLIDYLLDINWRISEKTIESLKECLTKKINKQKKDAISLISISELKYKHDYIKIKSLSDIKIKDHGITLLSAGHGEGKTALIGIPFIKKSSGQAMVLCHLKSLTVDISRRFNITKYDEYSKRIKDIIYYSGFDSKNAISYDNEKAISICLPSIILTLEEWVKETDVLLIDEISQVLSFLADCRLKGFNNVKAFNRLRQIITTAKRVLVMDSDLDDSVIKFLEVCCPNEEFTIYEMPRKKTDFNVEWISVGNSSILADTAKSIIIPILSTGSRLIIATDTQNNAELLELAIKAIYPEKKVLRIDSKTSERKDVKEFISNINIHAKKYDVVVHSPSVKSGISLEDNEGSFDLGIGVFSGNSITSSDAIQMLRRDRNLKNWILCVSNPRHQYSMTAKDKQIGMEQADKIQAIFDGRVYGDRINDFDIFKTEQEEKAKKGKINFATNLYYQLKEYKFNIIQSKNLDVIDTTINLSNLKKEIKKEWVDKLIHSKIISSFEFEQIKNAKNLTIDQKASIEVYKINSFLKTDKITDTIIKIWDNHKCKEKIILLELLINGWTYNNVDFKLSPLSIRKFVEAKFILIANFISLLNLKIENYNVCGTISELEQNNALLWVWDKRILLSYLGLIPEKYGALKAKKPIDAKKLIKQILENAFIFMERKRKRMKNSINVDNREYLLLVDNKKMLEVIAIIKRRNNINNTIKDRNVKINPSDLLLISDDISSLFLPISLQYKQTNNDLLKTNVYEI